MTPGARAAAPWRYRIPAAAALALALVLGLLPLRHRIALVRGLRVLPVAPPARLAGLDTAVRAVIPAWWPGRIACMEISLATVLAAALTGRHASWVLGARFRPHAAHAWAEVPGHAAGRDVGDAADRPWLTVLRVP